MRRDNYRCCARLLASSAVIVGCNGGASAVSTGGGGGSISEGRGGGNGGNVSAPPTAAIAGKGEGSNQSSLSGAVGSATMGGLSAVGGQYAASGFSLSAGGTPAMSATSLSIGGLGNGTPSEGCSMTTVAVAVGTAIDGTIPVGTQSRTYRMSVPTDYRPGEPLPLAFALNGVGGDGKGAQSAFQLETGHRGIFIYPDSSYNDTVSTVAWFFEEEGVDVAFFDALVKFATANYCVDKDRIFALGVSSGAIMANMLGCYRGEVLRAIAPASGMTWSNRCKGDVAVMVFCGEQDSFNPCDDAKNGALSETNFWAPHNGCVAEMVPSSVATICNAFQGCEEREPVLLCKHPGGHMWPTGGGDMMWSFFMGLPP